MMCRVRLGVLVLFVLGVLALGCGPSDGVVGGEQELEPVPEPQGPPAPTGAGVIRGTIRLEGDPPQMRPMKMTVEPRCNEEHPEGAQNPAYVVSPEGMLANVIVRIKEGLSEGSYPIPADKPVMDQVGCLYTPHVLVVRAGYDFLVRNSDPLLHNVHALADRNREFNIGMVRKGQETTRRFTEPELVQLKCDVHPWMRAFIWVSEHPYVTVSDEQGRFEISGLPAGEYVVEAWHEKMGPQEHRVTVADPGDVELDITFQAPPSMP